jgi:hypothetical protein
MVLPRCLRPILNLLTTFGRFHIYRGGIIQWGLLYTMTPWQTPRKSMGEWDYCTRIIPLLSSMKPGTYGWLKHVYFTRYLKKLSAGFPDGLNIFRCFRIQRWFSGKLILQYFNIFILMICFWNAKKLVVYISTLYIVNTKQLGLCIFCLG